MLHTSGWPGRLREQLGANQIPGCLASSGLQGTCPASPDLWPPPFPGGVAELRDTPGPQPAQAASCTRWVFRGERLPASGWSPRASARQTNRKRLPFLCPVNLGVPDSSLPAGGGEAGWGMEAPAGHSHGQDPVTLGAAPSTLFLPNKN